MKLGSFAPIEATPEHTAEQLASDVSERGGVGQAGAEHRHLVRVSRECHELRGFDAFTHKHGWRDHLGGGAAERLIEVAETPLASAPVIVPVDLAMCGATSAGYVALRPPCTNLPRPTSTRSTSSCHSRACGSRRTRTSGLGPLRHSLMPNAISTDEELIDDLDND
jgi:hypothetical protein